MQTGAGAPRAQHDSSELEMIVGSSLAGSPTTVLDQRKLLAGRIEELLDAHPLAKALTSNLESEPGPEPAS